MFQSLFFFLKQQILLFIVLWIVALMSETQVLLSISMIGLSMVVVLQREQRKIVWRKDFLASLSQFHQHKDFLFISFYFVAIFFSIFYSTQDLAFLTERVLAKLPFVVLPIIFLNIAPIKKNDLAIIYYVFLISLLASALFTLIKYYTAVDFYNEKILAGQSLPTPFNHILLSLMTAFAIFLCQFMLSKKMYGEQKLAKYLLISLLIFFFIFLHILSVRSGIAGFYFTLLMYILYILFMQKDFKKSLLLLSLCIVIPYLAYQFVPSFKHKISYMQWDWKMYKDGTGKDYSDSKRWISMQAGMELVKENPILGVGVGDIKAAINEVYKEKYPFIEDKYLMPHNQFLYTLAGSGIIGLICLLIAFFTPFFFKNNHQHLLIFVLTVLFFFTFFIEYNLENAMRRGFFLLFLLLSLYDRNKLSE